MATKYAVGIDLGGTKIATVLTDLTGKIVNKVEVETRAHEGKDAVLKRINNTVYQVMEPSGITRDDLAGIGIGSPGPLDPERGVVLRAPNLKWKEEVPLRDVVKDEFQVATYLDNDANAAAAGEYRFGAGKGCKNLIYVTVSTGVGSGIIVDGKVYRGAHGTAGELGHTIVDPAGPQCGCGKHGCLEAFSSGTAIARRTVAAIREGNKSIIPELVGDDLEKITSKTVAEAAHLGDELACQMWESAGDYLGIGMANVINFLDPEMIIIGGGVSKVGELLFEPMRRSIAKRAIESVAKRVKIVPAALGSDVGSLGAVSIALEAVETL